MYQSKSFFHKQNDKASLLKIKFIEHFTAWYTYLIFFIIILALYGLFALIVWVIDPSACEKTNQPNEIFLGWQFITNRWVNSSIGFGFAFSFTFLTIFDIVTHCKRKKGCFCRDFYFKEDPYLFRFEVIFFYLCAPFNVFIVTINSLFHLFQLETEILVLTIFFDLLPNFVLACIINLFPLSVTMVKSLCKCMKKKEKVDNDSIVTLLSNPDLHDSFKDFAKSEWSVENVLLYDDIINFEKSMTLEDAKKIISNYLEKGAPLEVNITRKEADIVIKKMNDGELTSELFSDIKQTTLINLGDTYARYIFSDDYITWEFKNKMKENI